MPVLQSQIAISLSFQDLQCHLQQKGLHIALKSRCELPTMITLIQFDFCSGAAVLPPSLCRAGLATSTACLCVGLAPRSRGILIVWDASRQLQ